MWILFVVVGALLVAVIALVAIGREAFTLGHQPKQALFDLDEAVDYVADRLPDDITARVSYDDVRSIIRWHLEYLREQGVPARRDLASADGAPVVVEDDEGVAYVLGKADENGLDVTDVEVASVLEFELAYVDAIGAIGAETGEAE